MEMTAFLVYSFENTLKDTSTAKIAVFCPEVRPKSMINTPKGDVGV